MMKRMLRGAINNLKRLTFGWFEGIGTGVEAIAQT